MMEESLGPNIESLPILEDDHDVKFNIFEARKDGGMNVYKDRRRKFEWPSIDEASEPPTKAQALEDLERCIFFAPSQVGAAGIAFTTLIQYRGEAVITKPGEYHQVSNLLTSLAIPTNHSAPGETPSFFDENQPLEVCDGCGLKPLYGTEGFHVMWVDPDVPALGPVDSDATATGQKRSALPPIANTKKRRKKDMVDAVLARKSQRRAVNLSSNKNHASEKAQEQQAMLSKTEGHDKRGRFVVPLP